MKTSQPKSIKKIELRELYIRVGDTVDSYLEYKNPDGEWVAIRPVIHNYPVVILNTRTKWVNKVYKISEKEFKLKTNL